jgi:hypothetical protein
MFQNIEEKYCDHVGSQTGVVSGWVYFFVQFMCEEVEQTNTWKEEKLAGTSTEDAIRKSSQAAFILSSDRRTWFRKAKKNMVWCLRPEPASKLNPCRW